jgi:colanic acid/amylovoran biosynthesis protein
MSIVITGVTGCRNRGVEALVVSTVDQIRQRMPDQYITILTHTPDYDATCIQLPQVKFAKSDFAIHNWGRALRLRKTMASLRGKPLIMEPQTEAATRVREASIIVASGGDIFSSDYGSLGFHLEPLKLAQRHNVPVVFLAHSIGPFYSPQETNAWLNVGQHSPLVTVRETLTYKYVTEELGLPSNIVHLTADPAFLLIPPARETVEKMLTFYGIEIGHPTIALSVSQGVSRFANVGHDEHFSAWCRVIQTLLAESDVQLLLIPHVQSPLINNDDRFIATTLLKHFDYHPRLHLAGGVHSAAEFKGLIGACDMVIAERMHVAIAGLSNSICTVVIGYSVKAEGIMQDLLGPESIRDFVIPIQEFVEGTTSIQTIQTAWQKRKETEVCLKQVLPQIKSRAADNFDLLAKLLA